MSKDKPTSRDVMKAGGVDPDAPFEVGPFPSDMRMRPATDEEAQRGLNDTWPGDPVPVAAHMSKDIEEIARAIALGDGFQFDSLEPAVLGTLDLRDIYRNRAQAAYSVMEKRLGEYETLLSEARQFIEYYPAKGRQDQHGKELMLQQIDAALNDKSKPVENGHG